MNMYAVMWAKGINEWEVCKTMGDGVVIPAVYLTKKAADKELKSWVEADGPDNYKVAKLDVVIVD